MEKNGTPLHDAASQGNFDLIKEIYEKNPQLAQVPDYRRRLALHFASARGYTEIASLLVSNDDLDMCSARDIDGRNPLHLAAMNGKVEVLNLLVQRRPHAGEARAGRGETILHICFKYNQKEALKLLLENAKIQELVNAKDDDGNTLLHLVVADQNATAPINHEIVKCLLACPNVDANATNFHGDTPLDIALKSVEKLKKLKIQKKIAKLQVNSLRVEGAKTAKELKIRGINWLAKKRDALMVVASLIATMAFQAAVTPPGGLFQDKTDGHIEGESVLAHYYPAMFSKFLKSNTVGFLGSLSVILLLISGLPFKNKFFMWALTVVMWATISAMAYTYAIAVAAIIPNGQLDAASVTIGSGVLIWLLIMAILLLIHTIRIICLSFKKVRNIKYYISKAKKKLGFRKQSVSGPTNSLV